MSFLSDYVSTMEKYTDAPSVFHEAVAYGVLGSLLTTKPYRLLLEGGVPARWTNQWFFLVGDSGKTRKSTCVNMGGELLAALDPTLRAPDDSTTEGFMKDLAYRDRGPGGSGSAASLLMVSEGGSFFASLSKTYNNGLKQFLMDMYDVPGTFKRKLSKDEVTVHKPRVSLIGGVAIEFLTKSMTSDDWLAGFMGRCMLIYGERKRTLEMPGTPGESVYKRLADDAMDKAKAWAKTRKRLFAKLKQQKDREHKGVLIGWDDQALKYIKANRRPKSTNPDVETFLSRADVHLYKLAAVAQVDLDPDRGSIGIEAAKKAMPLWTHYTEHAPHIFEMCFGRDRTDVEGDRVARRIMRVLVGVGADGITEQALMRATILNEDEFSKGLNALKAAGLASVEMGMESDSTPMVVASRLVSRPPEMN